MLVAGVVHDQVRDNPHSAFVRFVDQLDEVPEIPEIRENLHKVGNVVSAVFKRGLVKWQKPQAVDAEPLEIIQLVDETADISGSVPV